MLPKLLVFASGTPDGGGSGFETLAENARTGILRADIVAVVSNHPDGGVRRKSDRLGIPFAFFGEPWTLGGYQAIAEKYKADYIALSGWLKMVSGLDPRRTINIHPAPLPDFGGAGLYGHHAHEAVLAAYREDKIKNSAVSMHFVTEEYDRGPVFFEYPVAIRPEDTPQSLAARVSEVEHGWQAFVTNLVVNEEISWDGKDPNSLKVPGWFRFVPAENRNPGL